MKTVEVGIVAGEHVYIEKPIDEWEILKNKIKREIEFGKIKAGDKRFMRVCFNSTALIVEINVRDDEDIK